MEARLVQKLLGANSVMSRRWQCEDHSLRKHELELRLQLGQLGRMITYHFVEAIRLCGTVAARSSLTRPVNTAVRVPIST